jgi:hypothetical protein
VFARLYLGKGFTGFQRTWNAYFLRPRRETFEGENSGKKVLSSIAGDGVFVAGKLSRVRKIVAQMKVAFFEKETHMRNLENCRELIPSGCGFRGFFFITHDGRAAPRRNLFVLCRRSREARPQKRKLPRV